MKSLGQAPIQYDWCPHTRKGDEDRRVCIRRKDHAKTEGKGSAHEPRREAPEEINPAHLELGLPTSGL